MVTCQTNGREANTSIIEHGGVEVETWVSLHPNFVIAQVHESLERSKLNRLIGGRSETTPRRMGVGAGQRTVMHGDLCVVLVH